jgi:hypothetical protein
MAGNAWELSKLKFHLAATGEMKIVSPCLSYRKFWLADLGFARFARRFPQHSTSKSHRPQVLHNGG